MVTRNFRNARSVDAKRCFDIETSAYQGEEAATLGKIAKRIATYPEGFLILEMDGRVTGFINCGCAHTVEMADEEFKDLKGHDPDAPNVVIMSVVIDPLHQGKGHSRALMEEFVSRMQQMGKSAIYLMCKEQHIPLYEKLGYCYLRVSASDHGGKTWHEMSREL